MQIFIHRNNTEGLIGYNADGSFVPLHIIQDNMFKLYDKTITSINYDKNLGYQIVRIPTTDNIPTYQLRQPAQQVIAMRGGGGGGGIKGINVQEEGVPIGIKATFNFIGLGATATNVGGGVVEIDIPGGIACADNGLNIGIGGCVELGGTLFHNTIIDFDGFDLTFDFNGGNFNFQNVPVSVAPTSFLTLDAGGNIQANPTGAGNGMFWALDGNTNGIERYIGTNDTFDFPIYTDGTEKMRVLTTGQVGIGTSTPNAAVMLEVVGSIYANTGLLVSSNPSGTEKGMAIFDSTTFTPRWDVIADSVVEGGANSGSDFRIVRFSDAGAPISVPFYIRRSDGTVSVNSVTPPSDTQFYVQGTGTTSATFAMKVDNATPIPLLYVRDDGYISAGIANGSMTIGLGAGFNDTLSNNTFLGVTSGTSITTGTGTANTGVGSNALNSITDGINNVAVGFNSLALLTVGQRNTAVGTSSGINITSGSRNIFMGENSGGAMTTDFGHVAIGWSALSGQAGNSSTAEGIMNVSVGYNNLAANTTGTSLSSVGSQALVNNTTGEQNTAIGALAGFTNITGSRSVYIGYESGYFETLSDKLFIDTRRRVDETDGRNKALIYGKFDALVANQFLVFNGVLYLLDTVTATYWSGTLVGGVLTWVDTLSPNAPA